MTDPRPRMKSFRQDESTGVIAQAPFLIFGDLILKNKWKCPNKIGSRHRLMHPIQNSHMKASGAS